MEQKIKEFSYSKDDLRSRVKDLGDENEMLQLRIKKLEKKKHAAEEQRDKVAAIAVQDADDSKVLLLLYFLFYMLILVHENRRVLYGINFHASQTQCWQLHEKVFSKSCYFNYFILFFIVPI